MRRNNVITLRYAIDLVRGKGIALELSAEVSSMQQASFNQKLCSRI